MRGLCALPVSLTDSKSGSDRTLVVGGPDFLAVLGWGASPNVRASTDNNSLSGPILFADPQSSSQSMNMVAQLADILRSSSAMTDDLGAAEYSALAAFHEQLHRTIDATTTKTRQAGLQPLTFLLLLALRRLPPDSPATSGELAVALGWNRSEVADLLDDLERRSFITRTRDKADRRRLLISLTPTGTQWLTPLAKDVFRDLAVSGPDLLRSVRTAVSHAAATAARPQAQVRADISNFAWRAVGSAPI